MTLSSVWVEQTFVFTPGKESSSPCSEGELFVPAVKFDVFQTSKPLFTSKRKAEEAASITNWSVMCPQGKG